MKIDIRGRTFDLSEPLRTHIERRLRFALGRFGTRIEAVTVTVEDLNGPRGGVDKQCRIVVALTSAGHIRVEVRDADVTTAVDCAADRVGRAVTREIERHHTDTVRRPSVSRVAGTAMFQRRKQVISGDGTT